MNIIPPAQWILTNYQNMGFSRDLIIQAWNQCRENPHLLLNTLLRLCPRQAYIQQVSQNPRIKRIPNSVLIKKMPRIKHVHLRFEGNKALEFLELRKLGLFSKKAFKDANRLTLEYIGSQNLRNGHLKILANHINRGMRKLKNLSIKLEMNREYGWAGRGIRWQQINVTINPLLNSLKQSFVNLISLQLFLGKGFQFSILECKCFDRRFAKIRATLKHIDLDFTGNESVDIVLTDIFETLAMVIMNRLHKLEALCLNFSQTKISTRIVRLLMAGACTHLTRLRSLDLKMNVCIIVHDDWSSYYVQDSKSNIQNLKLDFSGCEGLSLLVLTMLKNDILTLCPQLKSLFVCTLECIRYSNEFYGILEEEFLQKLNLNWLKLLYSHHLEKNLKRYEEIKALDMKRTILMEKKVATIKQRARGEEEVSLYLQTLIEEEQAPTKHELNESKDLQNNFLLGKAEIELEDQERLDHIIENFEGKVEEAQDCLYDNSFSEPDYENYEKDWYEREKYQDEVDTFLWKEYEFQNAIEAEIRFRDLTKGGTVTQISLDYGDYFYR